jgi:hypothetical protein
MDDHANIAPGFITGHARADSSRNAMILKYMQLLPGIASEENKLLNK